MCLDRGLMGASSAAGRRTAPGRLDEVASSSYLDRVQAVGLKILKNRLSEYVRLAAAGETVLVTDRERVVAELTPPREGRATQLQDAMLAEAVRSGWLTPPIGTPDATVPHRPVAPIDRLLVDLESDRADP